MNSAISPWNGCKEFGSRAVGKASDRSQLSLFVGVQAPLLSTKNLCCTPGSGYAASLLSRPQFPFCIRGCLLRRESVGLTLGTCCKQTLTPFALPL